MIEAAIPGEAALILEHLALDLNGTITLDGEVVPGAAERLTALSAQVAIHLLTADTRGQAAEIADQLGVHLVRIDRGDEPAQKRQYVERLGPGRVVAIGNGANDCQMLEAAVLGIAVLGNEGLAVATLNAADIVVASIRDALDLLLTPQRLAATLRH